MPSPPEAPQALPQAPPAGPFRPSPSAPGLAGRSAPPHEAVQRAAQVLASALKATQACQDLLQGQGPPGGEARLAVARQQAEVAQAIAHFEAAWTAASAGLRQAEACWKAAQAAQGPLARQQALAAAQPVAWQAQAKALFQAACALKAQAPLAPFLPASLASARPIQAPAPGGSPAPAPPQPGGLLARLGEGLGAWGRGLGQAPPGASRAASGAPSGGGHLAPQASPAAAGATPEPEPEPPSGPQAPRKASDAASGPPARAGAGTPAPSPPLRPGALPLPAPLAEALAQVEPVHQHTAHRLPYLEAGLAWVGGQAAGPPPGGAVVVEALALLYSQSPEASIASRTALVQATELRRGIALARQQPLGPITPAKLRGLAIPLTGFPQRFAPFPVLCELFPAL